MLMKLKKSSEGKGDVWILILTILLSGFGVIAIYSASHYVAEKQYGDALYFVKKQGDIQDTASFNYLVSFEIFISSVLAPLLSPVAVES